MFYPDLQDEAFASRFAIYHQRYSTNTFPTWWLAQPFRCLAHNGEINTLNGNQNWMKSHETRMARRHSASLPKTSSHVLPGALGHRRARRDFEVMVRSGRTAPTAKSMLVPEAWSKLATRRPPPAPHMYAYFHRSWNRGTAPPRSP